MEFSIRNFFSKCDKIRRTEDLVTLTKEILNEKLHFSFRGQCPSGQRTYIERTRDVQKTSKPYFERPMYVQFTFLVKRWPGILDYGMLTFPIVF